MHAFFIHFSATTFLYVENCNLWTLHMAYGLFMFRCIQTTHGGHEQKIWTHQRALLITWFGGGAEQKTIRMRRKITFTCASVCNNPNRKPSGMVSCASIQYTIQFQCIKYIMMRFCIHIRHRILAARAYVRCSATLPIKRLCSWLKFPSATLARPGLNTQTAYLYTLQPLRTSLPIAWLCLCWCCCCCSVRHSYIRNASASFC